MNYYIVEPEVAGEIGKHTIYDYNNASCTADIIHLHFVFEGWLGDDLLEVTPCFIVTEKLRDIIFKYKLSGCEFCENEISYSEIFYELYPKRNMPNFYRLMPQKKIDIVKGIKIGNNMDDIMLSQKNYLVISEKAKNIISDFSSVRNSDFELLTIL